MSERERECLGWHMPSVPCPDIKANTLYVYAYMYV